MNEIDLMSPSKVAEKYGGDKRRIAQAAQMGLLDPTVAVMAGMFIDRMRGAAAKEQKPQSTVAQDVMSTPSGVADLPVPDSMYGGEQGFAGGGIIAFQNEGFVDPIFNAPDIDSSGPDLSKFTDEEKMQYLQGRIGYPQAAELTEGKITLDQLFKDIYGRTSVIPSDRTTRPRSAAEIKEERIPTPAPAPKDEEPRVPPTGGKVDEKKAEKAITDYAQKVKDINKKFGVSDTPDAEARAAIEKYKEKLNKDLDKAGALGLLQAGLGIAGGKSQYALQNLAGAVPGITAYERAAEKIRGEERGVLESEVKLAQADDARRRGDAKLALELEKDAERLAIDERKAVAAEKQAAKPSAVSEYIDLFTKDPKKFREFMEAQRPGFETADIARQKATADEFMKIYGNDFMKLSNSKKPEDQAKARQMLEQFYAARGVKPPMGAGGTGGVDTSNPLLK